jgi:hypothetical protein
MGEDRRGELYMRTNIGDVWKGTTLLFIYTVLPSYTFPLLFIDTVLPSYTFPLLFIDTVLPSYTFPHVYLYTVFLHRYRRGKM